MIFVINHNKVMFTKKFQTLSFIILLLFWVSVISLANFEIICNEKPKRETIEVYEET